MDLRKLMTGANPQSVMLEQTRGLKSKWQKTGLLEGIKSETNKHGMSVILENQAKQLLDEATRTGVASGSEEWAGVALPLVRRIFGSIAAKEFVSVQPMNLPSGLVRPFVTKTPLSNKPCTSFKSPALAKCERHHSPVSKRVCSRSLSSMSLASAAKISVNPPTLGV